MYNELADKEAKKIKIFPPFLKGLIRIEIINLSWSLHQFAH